MRPARTQSAVAGVWRCARAVRFAGRPPRREARPRPRARRAGPTATDAVRSVRALDVAAGGVVAGHCSSGYGWRYPSVRPGACTVHTCLSGWGPRASQSLGVPEKIGDILTKYARVIWAKTRPLLVVCVRSRGDTPIPPI